MYTLKNNIKITHFVFLMSFINFIFFHYPFFKFVFNNLDYRSVNGIFIITSFRENGYLKLDKKDISYLETINGEYHGNL